MKTIELTVNNCYECPYISIIKDIKQGINFWYYTCRKQNKELEHNIKKSYPEDCPLKDIKKEKKVIRDLYRVKKGEYVKCIKLHPIMRKCYTLNKEYLVINNWHNDWNNLMVFKIRDDNGKIKIFNNTTRHFALCTNQ